PDLPQGYQISQYKSPIVGEGAVAVDLEDGSNVVVGIERVHLEQDAGKSLHDRHPNYSYVDLNRSGVALMEIVSKPDLRSSGQAIRSARAARSRTSTPSASSVRRSSTRRGARSRSSRRAARSSRRRACSI